MEEKPADTEVFFIDAVHPEHTAQPAQPAQPAYGWMKRGEPRVLKTNNRQDFMNEWVFGQALVDL